MQTIVRLNNNIPVLGKVVKGHAQPVRYSNRTQAEAAVARLGKDWFVYHGFYRPFYAAVRLLDMKEE